MNIIHPKFIGKLTRPHETIGDVCGISLDLYAGKIFNVFLSVKDTTYTIYIGVPMVVNGDAIIKQESITPEQFIDLIVGGWDANLNQAAIPSELREQLQDICSMKQKPQGIVKYMGRQGGLVYSVNLNLWVRVSKSLRRVEQ